MSIRARPAGEAGAVLVTTLVPVSRYRARVMVVNRFSVPLAAAEQFRTRLETAHGLLASRPGYVEGQMGRNLDDPELWTLVTRWVNVGAYRRALSSPEVKMAAVPVLSEAIDEPSAYEPIRAGVGLDELDRRTADLDRRTADLDPRGGGPGR